MEIREDYDRRTGKDRRYHDAAILAPDRRADEDRRTGEDRRSPNNSRKITA